MLCEYYRLKKKQESKRGTVINNWFNYIHLFNKYRPTKTDVLIESVLITEKDLGIR